MNFISNIVDYINSLSAFTEAIFALAIIGVIFVLTYIVYIFSSKYILDIHKNNLRKKDIEWIKFLLKFRILNKLYMLIPPVFLYVVINITKHDYSEFTISVNSIILKLTIIWIIIIISILIASILNALNLVYQSTFDMSKHIPIRGYIDLIKVITWIIAIILIISSILDVSPVNMLAGLGALSALILLVFKDTILGFISNIQLTAYDIIRIGDWVEVTQHNVSGIILDITLNTVKIQSFDKSIVTVPSYDIITRGIINWQGMYDAGERRMVKHINVDIYTIKFCDDILINKIKNIQYMKKYLDINTDSNVDVSTDSNVEKNKIDIKISNLTLYKYYSLEYLYANKNIIKKKNARLSVHYLQSSPEFGLPVEIYAYINKTNSTEFDKIQSAIIEHLIIMLNVFDLKPYQR